MPATAWHFTLYLFCGPCCDAVSSGHSVHDCLQPACTHGLEAGGLRTPVPYSNWAGCNLLEQPTCSSPSVLELGCIQFARLPHLSALTEVLRRSTLRASPLADANIYSHRKIGRYGSLASNTLPFPVNLMRAFNIVAGSPKNEQTRLWLSRLATRFIFLEVRSPLSIPVIFAQLFSPAKDP